MNRHVVISGCSGGGKSTLLAALGALGHAVVEEPGRRIVRAARGGDRGPLPWVDLAAFARRALALSLEDRRAMADEPGWVFYDRGLVDAAVALSTATGLAIGDLLEGTPPYHGRVFLAPPWPDLFREDAERRHDLAAAIAEHERLAAAYPALGYEVVTLPRLPVEARADFLLAQLGQ